MADSATLGLAEEVGRRLASAGCAVVTGGLGGVMEAASRGASLAGGLAASSPEEAVRLVLGGAAGSIASD